MSELENIVSKLSTLSVQDDINKQFSESLYKEWVKLIPLNKELSYDDFVLSKEFKKVADVVIDVDIDKKGNKARNTVIKFIPTTISDWINTREWIYIFTINDKIVKIGGTRTGLKGRSSSYLCGHHIPQRGKSGKCSVTNAHIYNTFDFYLNNGFEVIMYGFMIPECKVPITILDETTDVDAQVYHAYEAKFLKEYKKITGRYPYLSDNADPNYK
jgi:hypothetical protein